MEAKFADYQEILKKRFSNFGEWSDSNPFMINSFLQDHFALTSLIEEANRHQVEQSREIDGLRSKLEIATNKYTNLLCFNRKMFDDNNNLIQTLEKYRSTIDSSEYHESISEHRKFYESILEESQSVMLETIRWTT
jgi:vacuolar-type H+-ATPase subunit I/STV1